MRIHSPTLVHQVLAGVLLAKLVNKEGYDKIVESYLAFSEKFTAGNVEEIDLMRKAINFLG